MENSMIERWKARAAEAARGNPANQQDASEAVHLGTSMLTSVYGPGSPQLAQFMDGCRNAQSPVGGRTVGQFNYAIGAIRSTLAELEGGLVQRMRVVLAGEVLSDLVSLAKATLEEKAGTSVGVGAVLAAAAYEGVLRKMGEEFASVTGRPKLEEVIRLLKEAGVLQGAQVGIALSYLNFRNNALHADWEKIDRTQVEACLAFVESLLAKHFS